MIFLFNKLKRSAVIPETIQFTCAGKTAFEFFGLTFLNLRLSLLSKHCHGEPTVTVRPNAAQKFQRDKQAGGGAYIPETIKVEGPREYERAVLDKVRTTLAEC